MKKNKMNKLINAISGILILGIFVPYVCAASDFSLSNGQTVYVSVYTHIYSGLKGRPFQLGATLSIRNSDPKYPITLVSDMPLQHRGIKDKKKQDEIFSKYMDTHLDLALDGVTKIQKNWKKVKRQLTSEW